MMRVLVIGLGEVGRPLYEIIKECNKFEVYGYDIDPSRTVNKLEDVPRPVDYVHICIPYKNFEDFITCLRNYREIFTPRLIIIHSTVAPGTTRVLHDRFVRYGTHVVHSPVRGVHKKMKEHLKFWTKWIGAPCDTCRDEAKKHLEEIGFKVRVASSPESTELGKLWETILRAVLISTWHEIHRTTMMFGGDLVEIGEFIGEVHEVLHDRPVMYPDVIGGHCLIPNTELLLKVYESPLLKFVLESNEKRKRELTIESARRDVERLKNFIYEKLINKKYFE
ncbi:MAG: GDP-mannose dehydrogenase [Crenarchaeota archaeon]|nr:GDP-mannose dehydrogenase [Thermoproteota archaeon]